MLTTFVLVKFSSQTNLKTWFIFRLIIILCWATDDSYVSFCSVIKFKNGVLRIVMLSNGGHVVSCKSSLFFSICGCFHYISFYHLQSLLEINHRHIKSIKKQIDVRHGKQKTSVGYVYQSTVSLNLY